MKTLMLLSLIQTLQSNKTKSQKDSIAVESAKDNPYANLIAVKEGHQDDKKIKALIEVLQSKDIQDFINENTTVQLFLLNKSY